MRNMAHHKHPEFINMLELANKNTRKYEVSEVAFSAYMELCEVKKLSKIYFSYDDDLECFYITRTGESLVNSEIFVPISTKQKITLEVLEKIQEKLSPEVSVITLIIKDSDSSSTYYNITKGLVPPLSPEAFKSQQESINNIHRLESSIDKNKKFILTETLRRDANRTKLEDTSQLIEN